MVKTFRDKQTEQLFCDGASRRLPPDIIPRALRKLDMVDNAYILSDLRVPPSNRLHALSGNRQGEHSISINDQWRICFRFEEHDAFDVQVCDYH